MKRFLLQINGRLLQIKLLAAFLFIFKGPYTIQREEERIRAISRITQKTIIDNDNSGLCL